MAMFQKDQWKYLQENPLLTLNWTESHKSVFQFTHNLQYQGLIHCIVLPSGGHVVLLHGTIRKGAGQYFITTINGNITQSNNGNMTFAIFQLTVDDNIFHCRYRVLFYVFSFSNGIDPRVIISEFYKHGKLTSMSLYWHLLWIFLGFYFVLYLY